MDTPSRRSIYFWATGQDDNVGDVLLRRRMLRTLQRHGVCHLFVDQASPGFIDSLLAETDRDAVKLYRTFGSWALAATLHSLGRGWVLAYNPGEIKVSAWYAKFHALLLPAQLLGRLRSNPTIRAAVGIHGAGPDTDLRWAFPIRLAARLSALNTWRNQASRDLLGVGDLQPDWGFDENLADVEVAAGRTLLAVTMRADRPEPSDEWCAAVNVAADRLGLTPIVVTQVRRDHSTGAALAARNGWRFDGWSDDTSHLDQERRVRTLYQASLLVVSDRLHALVMGLTEGAVPAGLFEHSDTKIDLHFTAAGFSNVGTSVRDWSSALIAEEIVRTAHAREALLVDMQAAREHVRSADVAIDSLLSSTAAGS
ncbi:hypothetical protein [Plantibacter flavus]|uniref:hypothetical protein n=1 Tax=Plantibacter flavus TaxID=150123 RepID=UPI00339AECA0